MTYELTLRRNLHNNISKPLLERQIDEIFSGALRNKARRKNWRITRNIIGPKGPNEDGTLQFECKVAFQKISGSKGGSTEKNEWADIRSGIIKKGSAGNLKTRPWEIIEESQSSKEASANTQSVLSNVDFLTWEDLEVPNELLDKETSDEALAEHDVFGDLYGINPQIRSVLSAIKYASETKGSMVYHSVLHGEPACLANKTKIYYDARTLDGESINSKGGTIKSLFDAFNKYAGKRQYFAQSVKEDNSIFMNRVVDVVKSGVKETFRVITETGKTVEATAEHRFLTDYGFFELRDLEVGMSLMCHPGIVRKKGKRKIPLAKQMYVRNHPSRQPRYIGGKYPWVRMYIHQFSYEAHRNGMTINQYKDFLDNNTDFEGIWTIPIGMHIHHKDENRLNNHPSNLQMVTNEEHGKIHGEKATEHLRYYAEPEKIVYITKVGEQPTYDISMESPYNNFMADKICVHNSGKTSVLAAVELLFGEGAVLRLDATATTKAGVEQIFFNDLDGIDPPPLVFCEEIEKANEDGLRVWLGALDERQEIRKVNARANRVKNVNVLFFCTCNDKVHFDKMMNSGGSGRGALSSRCTNQLYFPKPSLETIEKILYREIKNKGGKEEWVKPAIQLAGNIGMSDPRHIRALLAGGDRLLDGSYQADRIAIWEQARNESRG